MPLSEAVSLRRLQLSASDPSRSRDGFERIPRVALLAGERAPALAAGRRRQNKGGPALGACRSLVLSHGGNVPPDSLDSPFQIPAVEKNNSAHLWGSNGTRFFRRRTGKKRAARICPGSLVCKSARSESVARPRCDCPGKRAAPLDRSCWRFACWPRDDR